MQDILMFLFIVFVAAFVQGVTGFGFGIIFMCFIPILLGFKTSVGISVLLSLIQSVGIIVGLKSKPDIKKTLITNLSYIVCMIIGINLLFSFSNDTLKIVLGVTLILFAILFIGKEYAQWKIQFKKLNSLVIGGLSGIAGGMLGIGGPPIVFYYHSIFEDKNDYNINTQVTFAVVNAILLVLHISKGNITIETFKYSGLAFAVLLLSTWFGLRVFKKISKDILTKTIIGFLFIAGIVKLAL